MSVQLAEPIIQEPKVSSRSIQSGEQATRRANNYLAKYIGIHFMATDPELIQLDNSIWQVIISYKIPGLSPFRVGFLDIIESTGEAVPISDENKQFLIERANAFLESNASAAALPQRLS